jgi:single-strand DNA-binding protein
MYRILRKGSGVQVRGKLTHRKFTGTDGIQRTISEVMIHEFLTVGEKKPF